MTTSENEPTPPSSQAGSTANKALHTAGTVLDVVGTGASIFLKVMVSVGYLVVAYFCLFVAPAQGWWIGLIAVAYLVYLWVFKGSWLIW